MKGFTNKNCENCSSRLGVANKRGICQPCQKICVCGNSKDKNAKKCRLCYDDNREKIPVEELSCLGCGFTNPSRKRRKSGYCNKCREKIFPRKKYYCTTCGKEVSCRSSGECGSCCQVGSKNVSKRPEVRKKMRVKACKNFKKRGVFPNINYEACDIIEEYGEVFGYNFQTGKSEEGEYHIEKLGYWVDGYDKDKNVVIEFYEDRHKNQTKKDEERKREIVNHLKCDFIEIRSWNDFIQKTSWKGD